MSSEPHVRDRQYSVVVRTGDVTPINHPEKLPPIPYSNYLPSILKSNMGKWVDHRMITPAIMEHVAESGDRVFTIKVIGPPNARYSADTLEKLCDLADTYGIGLVRPTPQGNLEIITDREENAHKLEEELRRAGFLVGGWGNHLWNIQPCTAYLTCTTAVVDAPSMAKAIGDALYEYVYEKETPAHLSIKVSGCPNACGGAINASDVAVVGYPAQAPVADDKWFSQVSSPSDVIAACPVGAIVAKKDASGKAYSVSVRQELCVACGRCRDTTDAMAYDPGRAGVMVLVGGKASNSGRAGQLMSKIVVPYLPNEPPRWPTLVKVVKRIVDTWVGNAERGERMGDWVARIGWDRFYELTGLPDARRFLKFTDKPGPLYQPLYKRRATEATAYLFREKPTR
ncbi:sulfite reductase, dissimilatory-type beta subunit [Thermocladium modestius]|uniref:Sulfite reductase, dissimilatory-type beta subunit n=1 Tax=Thermocladium modestius TaxID=62609 RepID=A0A830GTU2_9CREN|nr:dissimilatory-type sulfite reductase subunit beta [Thermocladium modestius]GGP20734.1 sulfite reductase, dissimilatory-type beta subunit [Thermocladium modestius]